MSAENFIEYFHTAHLPAHLAAASEPFCDVARVAIISMERAATPLLALAGKLEQDEAQTPHPQRRIALDKIDVLLDEWCQVAAPDDGPAPAADMQLLLEAKDCAVRALVAPGGTRATPAGDGA